MRRAAALVYGLVMSFAVIAMSLLVTLAAVVWAALVLWSLISPREYYREGFVKRSPLPPAKPVRPLVEGPTVEAPEPPIPPVGGNVVRLDDWREKRKMAG